MRMKDILHRQNAVSVSHHVSPASLLDVSAGHYQRGLVNESGMIRIWMGMHSRSEIVVLCLDPIVATVVCEVCQSGSNTFLENRCSETSIHHFAWCVIHVVRSLIKFRKDNVLLYHFHHSSKCHFTMFIF
jgi:hypothetical protein